MRITTKLLAVAVCVVLAVCCFVTCGAAQSPAYTGPRTADHKPDLNGIWQAMNTADWDVSPHTARAVLSFHWARKARSREESVWWKAEPFPIFPKL